MNTASRSARLAAYVVAALTMLLSLLVATPAYATVTPVVVDGVTYSYDDATPLAGAVVTSYTPGVGQTSVTIESDVTVPGVGSVPVKTINDNVFTTSGLTSVTFNGNNLTTIGKNAFANNHLTTVTIPNSVTNIDTFAFSDSDLTTVTIGNSVTNIDDYAFAYNGLTTVTIPDSVTNIGNNAFFSDDLTTVTIPNSVTNIGTYAFYGNHLTTVAIGNSVTTIPNSAFANNHLTTATIPNSVTNIDDFAFYLNDLTTVAIGNSVTTIGNAAFYGNELTTATIGSSVTTIGTAAFAYNNLTTATIGNNVTTIGADAFYGNELTTATIGSSVTTIGSNAFAYNNLTTATIPNSVTTIGSDAFDENPALSSVLFAGPPPVITAPGGNESLDTASGSLVVHYVSTNAGWTSPLWNGYTTMKELGATATGNPREGSALTATPNQVVPASIVLAYQWYADGAPIAGATTSTHQLAKAQAGRRITVKVTATSTGGGTYSESAVTPPTPIVSSPYKRIVISAASVKRGSTFTVTATGFKAGQKYRIWLVGKTRYVGKADANGVVTRTVTFKSNTKAGHRRVRVSGYKSNGKRQGTIFTHVKYYK